MFDLLAQGANASQRWRLRLQRGVEYRLGRAPHAELSVPWDPAISRVHAQMLIVDDAVVITQQPAAINPLYFEGQAVRQCRVRAAQHFVIGQTSFHVHPSDSDSSGIGPSAVEEVAFTPSALRKIRYQDPDNRLEVLTHLPEVIAGAQDDQELYQRLSSLLLSGIVHAEAAAIVAPDESSGHDLRMLYWDRRQATAGALQPSRKLALEAFRREQSVLHVWSATPAGADRTLAGEFDWAFCTPVPGLTRQPLALYLAGKMGKTFVPGTTLSEQWQLEGDIKFAELVAEIIAAVLKARQLERQKAGLRQFFAPPILSALGDDLNTTLLEPRECDVTVMFCDLRGFSQRAERAADDLIGLLDRVSRALELMTKEILDHGGVTGDFQGDAALGFWGWPFASSDATLQACRAALGIRAAFARAAARKDHPLADFSMGIGIAHGRAVAGKIGTADQVKVTVFGPVVNLASRLEGMTRTLRVPIVLDEATAHTIRQRLPAGEGRVRRLARLLPYGLETPVTVSELLPPMHELPELTDAHVDDYERGVDAFIRGAWDEAYALLHRMPPSDRAQDFLLHQITQLNRSAPAGWDGVIRLASK